MGLPGFDDLSLFETARRAVKDFQKDDMSTHAAALTYRILLAIFPFLIFLLTLLGALGLSDFFDWLLEQAQRSFPSELYTQVETIVDQVRSGANGGLLSFGLITAIWAAAGGVRSVMHAFNVAYDVKEERPIWKLYPMSVLFTIGLASIVIAAAALIVLGPQTMEWLSEHAGFGDLFVTLWTWLRLPIAIVLMMLAIALMYYFFPNVEQPFRIVSPGSVIAVLIWLVATHGFSFYISSFANYNATYGSLGGIIILLLYFYISSMVLLFGAEVNAVIYKAGFADAEDNVDERARQQVRQEVNTSAA